MTVTVPTEVSRSVSIVAAMIHNVDLIGHRIDCFTVRARTYRYGRNHLLREGRQRQNCEAECKEQQTKSAHGMHGIFSNNNFTQGQAKKFLLTPCFVVSRRSDEPGRQTRTIRKDLPDRCANVARMVAQSERQTNAFIAVSANSVPRRSPATS